MPFSSDIDRILAPAQDVLTTLLVDPEKTGPRKIPAKTWLRKQKKSLTKTIVPLASGLTIVERAMIANWFEVKICGGDQTLRKNWIGLLPIAHAHTIYLAHKLKNERKGKDGKPFNLNKLLDEAWKIQSNGTKMDLLSDVDVDKDCLRILEELMFERSARAGVAGNRQWGLDVGEHQDGWDVYGGLPSYWNREDRGESEGEMEVRQTDLTLSSNLLMTNPLTAWAQFCTHRSTNSKSHPSRSRGNRISPSAGPKNKKEEEICQITD